MIMPILAPKKGVIYSYKCPSINVSNKLRIKNRETYRASLGEKFESNSKITDSECERLKERYESFLNKKI